MTLIKKTKREGCPLVKEKKKGFQFILCDQGDQGRGRGYRNELIQGIGFFF